MPTIIHTYLDSNRQTKQQAYITLFCLTLILLLYSFFYILHLYSTSPYEIYFDTSTAFCALSSPYFTLPYFILLSFTLPTHLLTYLFTYLLIHLLTYLLTYLLSFFLLHLLFFLTYTFTYRLTYLLTYSLLFHLLTY